jgi:BMFP domain-containing protein YqiC
MHQNERTGSISASKQGINSVRIDLVRIELNKINLNKVPGKEATMDKNLLDDLANKLADAVPDDISSLRDDLRHNFHAVLQTALGNLDLVSRNEFDVQRKVLERTRSKLEKLEQELVELRRDTIGDPDKPG